MRLEFKRLSEIDCAEIIRVNTHPLVSRHMPLAVEGFGMEECREWVAGKESLWKQHGYGPWAFVVDGRFAGWGGLQYESGEPDLGLVLHPNYWGMGKAIYDEILRRAFDEMKFDSITILLPPSRVRVKGILRLGFRKDGELELSGKRFIRYRKFGDRLRNP